MKRKPTPQQKVKADLVAYFGISPKEAGKFARRAVVALKTTKKAKRNVLPKGKG